MLRAFVFALVAIFVIQAYAAVFFRSLNEQQLVDSSPMLEVRGLGDRFRKFKGKFRQKLNPTSKSKDSDSIRAADTPRRSKASLNEGNEASIPSGAANSTTPKKHRGGRKMGPQPTSEEDPSKGKEPALPDSSPFNDTSQIIEGSNATTSQTKHHHHHPHHHHRTSNATANKHDDDDGDDTSTLKPPRRHRGSTVTTNVKPDLKRVNSSMSSGSDYAVTLSSEDGKDTRQSTKDTRPERLRSPGHHRTGSSASRHRSSIDTVTRTGSSASRGPNRGRPMSGSMNKPNDMSSTREREREKEKEREREREREKERAENRASALYAANQNTQMQTAQSAATNANTFATNFGNAAAPVPGMTKPPGTR